MVVVVVVVVVDDDDDDGGVVRQHTGCQTHSAFVFFFFRVEA